MTFQYRTRGRRTWPEIRDLVVRIAGPNRSFQPNEPYSQAHFDVSADICRASKDYRTIFFDTMTAAARLCFRWASAQPEAFSERTGKPDLRGAYGLHAREFYSRCIICKALASSTSS